uniref:Reticulon domain-containing protein n=2 Tax=Oryza TaxID=4527 RepID=A0A0E0ASD9_9ORYZ
MEATGGGDAAAEGRRGEGGGGAARWAVGAVCGGLVYYHCAVRRASAVSLAADVLLVLLCSLSILGLLFRHLHISSVNPPSLPPSIKRLVPVDPLEWQISQEMANSIVASLANTIGAAESVLRVAATGHDKKLFFKVVFTLYFLAALGRVVSGAAVAYAALCIFCLYMFAQSTDLFDQLPSWVPVGRDSLGGAQDTT